MVATTRYKDDLDVVIGVDDDEEEAQDAEPDDIGEPEYRTEKVGEWVTTYRNSITEKVLNSYPPTYRPQDFREVLLPGLLRTPKGGQGHAIKAISHAVNTYGSANVVGEMGIGKTIISIAATEYLGKKRVLVLCPPHLVENWEREIRQTLPHPYCHIVRDTRDLKRTVERVDILQRTTPDRPAYFILSREVAKRNYRWKAAYITRQERTFNTEGDRIGTGYYRATCPECYAPVTKANGNARTIPELEANRLYCLKCKGALWSADRNGERKEATADYITKRMKRWFDMIIVDEIHEYKGGKTAQGIAAGNLASVCQSCITLTGTLMGGYSSTLFFLLYRFNRQIKTDFGFHDMPRWVENYGFVEQTIRKEQGDARDGRMSKRQSNRELPPKEKPGLVPDAILHILPNTVFIRLHDVADDLPPYEEKLVLVPMESDEDLKLESQEDQTNPSADSDSGQADHDASTEDTDVQENEGASIDGQEVEDLDDDQYEDEVHTEGFDPNGSQESNYQNLQKMLFKAIVKTRFTRLMSKVVSTYVQSLLTYPDLCTQGENLHLPVKLNEDTGTYVHMDIVAPPMDADKLYPKEEALIKTIKQERAAGRRALVYVTHTNRRDIIPRLERVLRDAGIHSASMRTGDGGGAQHRETWIKQKLSQGIDVLICNPQLVATGLNLTQFPVIIWYEMNYSIYLTRQASRRSFRIGQDQNVTVYMMAYRGTMQEAAMRLISQKMNQSMMVEGQLPEDGLAQLEQDESDNLIMALAKSVLDGAETVGDLETIFENAKRQDTEDEGFITDQEWTNTHQYQEIVVNRIGAPPENQTPEETKASWEDIFGVTITR